MNRLRKLAVFALFAFCMVASNMFAQSGKVLHIRSFRSDDKAIMTQLISEFEATNPGVKVKYNVIADTNIYYQTLAADLASAYEIDVFDMHPTPTYFENIDDDYIMDISSLRFNSLYNPQAKKVTTYNGKNYGYLNSMNFIVLFYNKEILAKNSLAVPTDFKRLVDAVAALKKNGYGGISYCGADVAAVWLTHAVLCQEAGSDELLRFKVDVDSGKATNLDAFPLIKNGLRTLKAIHSSDLLYDNARSIKYTQSLSLFAQGKAPFMMMGTWTFGTAAADFPGIDFDIIPFYTLTNNKTTYSEPAQVTCIYKDSANPELAKKWVDFFASPAIAAKYSTATKQTSTIVGEGVNFPGAEKINRLLSDGVAVLPIFRSYNGGLWDNAFWNMANGILFSGNDVDQSIKLFETHLVRADIRNRR